MKKVAILVDGGFYKKRASYLWEKKNPTDRVNELIQYCEMHLKDLSQYTLDVTGKKKYAQCDLYRIFYYDCLPIKKTLYHPLLKKSIHLSKSEAYGWMNDFIELLTHKRKIALRMGVLAEDFASYRLRNEMTKDLLSGKKKIDELVEGDFELDVRQKGVDMKIGIDIASLAYKKQVDQIVLISGDSDFVPAAKLARREGIDFVVDSMGQNITSDLLEHCDGLQTYYKHFNP